MSLPVDAWELNHHLTHDQIHAWKALRHGEDGPNTVASVALPEAGLLIAIVCIEAPSTSDSRMNSCLRSSVM